MVFTFECDNFFGISINSRELLESTSPVLSDQGKTCIAYRTRLTQVQVVFIHPDSLRLAISNLLDRQVLTQRLGPAWD